MTSPLIIERIELTAFEIRIANLASGPGGLGVSYVPGPIPTSPMCLVASRSAR